MDELQSQVLSMLESENRCCLVRPTGCGKTWLMTKLIGGTDRYKKIMYLYPNDSIKATVENKLKDDFGASIGERLPDGKIIISVTYALLARCKDLSVYKDVDLIVADECHLIGGTKTKANLRKLLKQNNCALLGATATPVRNDMYDVVGDMFNFNVISNYTLHDAFEDGTLQKPYYYFCTYSKSNGEDFKKSDVESKLTTLGLPEEFANKRNYNLVKNSLIEISNLCNVDKCIREACSKLKDTSYMKFIVFFHKIDIISERGKEVKRYFQSAFPEKRIRITELHSETGEVDDVINLEPEDDLIDLIFVVNMLNMGYHVDTLTGIVMYRGTHSGIIFNQQLGRVLSRSSKEPKIVLDLVDNIHRKTTYEVLASRMQISRLKSSNKEKRILELERLENPTDKEVKELINLKTKVELEERFNELKAKDELTDKELFELKRIDAKINKGYNHVCDIQENDLIVNISEATIKEVIMKAVIEPKIHSARLAFAQWHDAYMRFVLGEKKKYKSLKELTKTDILELESDANIFANEKIKNYNLPPLKPYLKLRDVELCEAVDYLFRNNNRLANEEVEEIQKLKEYH